MLRVIYATTTFLSLVFVQLDKTEVWNPPEVLFRPASHDSKPVGASGKSCNIDTPIWNASADVSEGPGTLVALEKQPTRLYTVSRDGRVFQLEVTENNVRRRLLATLDAPFNQPSVRVEGLAVAPDGSLYASVVFVTRFKTVSRLYRLTPGSGTATRIGDIATTEVDGLDFSGDGTLYGAISSGAHAGARGLRQIVRIDINTGAALPTSNESSFADLDAIAINSQGLALVSNGSHGVFSVNPLSRQGSAGVFVDDEFRRFLRANDEMEGLCITQEGVLFGLCHEKRTLLVRIDQQTGETTLVVPLGISSLCLAASKWSTEDSAEPFWLTTSSVGSDRWRW